MKNIGLIFIGLLFMGVGIFLQINSRVDSDWVEVEGRVSQVLEEVDSDSDGSSSIKYRAVVRYSVEGTAYSVTSKYSGSSRPAMGSIRPVAYNPENPSDAQVVEKKMQLLLALGLIGMGIFGAAFGVWLTFRDLKSRATRRTF